MQSCASMWTQQSKAGWGRCHTQYTGPCWKCPYTPMSTRKENIVAAVFVVSDPPPGDKQRQTESDMFTRTASTRRWKLFAFPCVSFWEEAHWIWVISFILYFFLSGKSGRWRWSGPAGVCWIFSLIRLRHIGKSPKIFQYISREGLRRNFIFMGRLPDFSSIFFSLKCIASMAGWGGAMPQLFYCIVKVVHIGMKATEQLNNW